MTDRVEKILQGDVTTAAKLISEIDNGVPTAFEALRDLYPHTGHAYIIDLTGPPGAGKSMLADGIIQNFREKGKQVGVIAIDPTSPFTGGAILGDRVRMQRHGTDSGVFIRSLATRGHFGGLTQSTNAVLWIMEAMGKDIVIIETVGVGQDEVDIGRTAHTTIIVMVPGMDDEIQLMKAGIVEIGDIFVVNKADREGTEQTILDLQTMIKMGRKFKPGNSWVPLILQTVAISGTGVLELAQGVYQHMNFLQMENHIEKHNRERLKYEFLNIAKSCITHFIMEELKQGEGFDNILDQMIYGKIDPYSMVEKVFTRNHLCQVGTVWDVIRPSKPESVKEGQG